MTQPPGVQYIGACLKQLHDAQHHPDVMCVIAGDLEASADEEQRAALHRANPRLPALADKYGMMAGLTPSSGAATAGSHGLGGGTALGSAMLRLKLSVSSGDGGGKTVTKRLPGAPHALELFHAFETTSWEYFLGCLMSANVTNMLSQSGYGHQTFYFVDE